MTGDEQGKPRRRWSRPTVGQIATVVVLALTAAVGLRLLYPYEVGPRQPIPFSHRVHAGQKQISCFFCHPFADRSPNPGMPEVSTCMLCHEKIIREFPPIQELRAYDDSGTPIPWAKVTVLAEFAHVTHEMHIRDGIDCGRCHGDVKAMDRILLVDDFTMGFCVDCHREEDATVDCLACHH
jgi:hypothetical protein